MLHLMGSVMVWSLCFVIAFCTCGRAIAHLSVSCFLFLAWSCMSTRLQKITRWHNIDKCRDRGQWSHSHSTSWAADFRWLAPLKLGAAPSFLSGPEIASSDQLSGQWACLSEPKKCMIIDHVEVFLINTMIVSYNISVGAFWNIFYQFALVSSCCL